MVFKSNIALIILLICLFLIALIAAATLATQILLGYSGFQSFNGQQGLVKVETSCSNTYFRQRYGEPTNISIKISFVCIFGVIVLTLICFFKLLGCFCGCFQNIGERETMAQQTQIIRNSYFMKIEYPSLTQIGLIFIILSTLLIIAFVPFKIYLQFLLEKNNSTCSLVLEQANIKAITILSGLILILSIGALVCLAIIIYKLDSRQKQLDQQNFSESFRHQMKRIIKEIPDSERRFYDRKQEEDKQSVGIVFDHLKSIVERQSQSSPREQTYLQNMKKVQSVLYEQNPNLKLQSIVLQK